MAHTAGASRTVSRPGSSSAGSHRMGRSTTLKQWDGAKRACKDWDSLRQVRPGSGLAPLRRAHSHHQDPDLCVRDGNCLIHLHSKGRLKRDPAFKVPFSALITTKCFPFIQRFLVTDGYRPQAPDEILRWYRLNPRRTVELYVPPPPTGDKQQALQYHIATRNLLAWVLRRSLVGESLGGALVGLLHSMHEFRAAGEDNVGDLLEYVDEEGYLTLSNQPDYALAMLHLAEAFQLRNLYLGAFAHCVGMKQRLSSSNELSVSLDFFPTYTLHPILTERKNITSASRRLIRQKRAELDARLERTATMLTNFLDKELSEAHIGIPLGARMHLDRFRSFLLSFYSAKFGYYPPRRFDAATLRVLAEDFAALHALLEDDGYTAGPFDLMPSSAVGGICTLQLIQALDARNHFDPLQHPLPLLPQVDAQSSTRRIPWFPRSKSKADQRQVEHAALVRASHWREDLFRNDLVRAYRGFEEATVVAPSRADRHERVSLLDARKVRWILIYAVHQTLRQVTNPEAGVPDEKGAQYLLSASLDDVLPWREHQDIEKLARRQTDLALGQRGNEGPQRDDSTGVMEIKPDIDYFALTHKTPPPPPPSRSRRLSLTGPSSTDVSRSNSFKRALSRSSTLRRSVRRLKQATSSAVPTPPATAIGLSKPAYHEIVVHGYGNGTNNVSFDTPPPSEPLPIRRLHTSVGVTSRSGSTASASHSDSSTSSTGQAMTVGSPAETLASSITIPSPTIAPVADTDPSCDPVGAKPSRRWSQHGGSARPRLAKSNSLKRRPMSAAIEGYNYAKSLGHFVEQEGRNMLSRSGSSSGSRAGLSRRHSLMGGGPELRHKASMPLPRVIDEEEAAGVLPRDSGDWTAMQAFLDGKTGEEEYADLGGLIALR